MLCPIGQSNEKPPLQALAKWREYVTALEDGDSLNKAVEKAIAVYLLDDRANDINKDIKRTCENAIKESNINNAQKYPNKIIDFKNSTSIKEG